MHRVWPQVYNLFHQLKSSYIEMQIKIRTGQENFNKFDAKHTEKPANCELQYVKWAPLDWLKWICKGLFRLGFELEKHSTPQRTTGSTFYEDVPEKKLLKQALTYG